MSKTLTLGYMPDGTGAAFPFNAVFQESKNVVQRGMDGIDALVLWGGEDISPSYYKQKRHSKNQCWSGIPSKRDMNEWKALKYALMNNIPIIGVCRGAQMLCAFSGGKLIQHVDNHGRSHQIVTNTGVLMETSSSHHQMMYPFDVPHEMLAWTPEQLSTCYEDGDDLQIMQMTAHVEPEVVYFPHTKGLAIQGHPEWMQKSDPFVEYCVELVTELLLAEETV